MSELAIAFESWTLNPEKPGYVTFAGVKNRDQVECQIHDALKLIKLENGTAYDHAEWVSVEGKYDPSEFTVVKNARPIVFMRSGNSEGLIVEILLQSAESYFPIVRIKYLMGQTDVEMVVRELYKALENGMYGER
jgi:hypothetical protein